MPTLTCRSLDQQDRVSRDLAFSRAKRVIENTFHPDNVFIMELFPDEIEALITISDTSQHPKLSGQTPTRVLANMIRELLKKNCPSAFTKPRADNPDSREET